MEGKMDLQEYMTAGVENIMKNAVKVTLTNPAQSIFMTRFAVAAKASSKKRAMSEKEGEHIPAFLIASITSSCNLHCAGCYARAAHSCADTEPVEQLSAQEWDHIFEQAEEMGISFILLAGGEPMIRRDVIEKAGDRQNILFPIFTNGTLMNDTYFRMLKNAGIWFQYSVLKVEKNRRMPEEGKVYMRRFLLPWKKCRKRNCCLVLL